MAHPLNYNVYVRPRGGRRTMIAKFGDFKDAVYYAQAQSMNQYRDQNVTVHWADGKVAHRFINGERQ